ncbi:MAG TPA: cell surface protein, partial [Lachnospiraceae bacterium]|nr:cell surface protein [Lachnospiraceae bacterium]
LPDTITEIADFSFDDCTSLTSITIPNSVTKIGVCAFYGC